MTGTDGGSSSNRNGRVMVIGLDGATWQVARPWAEQGKLPTFKRLMGEGAWGVLESIFPPSTPVAWTSFATGMYPGKHGLFDFMARRKDSYESRAVNATNRDGRALWQLLSDAGVHVTVFNVPASYPPDQVNGSMMSGFLTPAHAADASWPREVQGELAAAVPGFTYYPPSVYTPGRAVEFFKSITDLNQNTLQAVRFMLKRQPWDFFMGVFMGTDIIQHFLWDQMMTGKGELPDGILQCYQQMDAVLAEMLGELTENDYLVLMSDHGFGGLTHYFHVNAWLVERGYLKFKRSPVSQLKYLGYKLGLTPLEVYQKLLSLGLGGKMQQTASSNNEGMKDLIKKAFLSLPDVDWERTRAYSMGFGGPVYVNLKGREPQGIVAPGAEYEALLQEIEADLRRMVDPYTGGPFVGSIYRRDQIFPGPHAPEAPDLMFFPVDWTRQSFGTHEFASHNWLEPCFDRTGTHRMDGLFLIRGPKVRRGQQVEGARIVDLAPTILALMGVPIPENEDGRVLTAAFEQDLLPQLDVKYTEAAAVDQRANPEYSQEDQELIEQHLRDLGYIG